jgi:hypothetical protein
MFLHFPERGARERVYGDESAWNFERGELRSADGFERYRFALADNICNRHFAAHAVRHPDHRCLRHTGLLEQELLDLTRVNIESAGNDEVATAALQRVVAVGRAGADVAGLEPAIDERGLSRFKAGASSPRRCSVL